ncbi:hypothetical protein FNAPI_13172 [Fusarium napiforme]|uniref:Uncharacterized protein n=1 Tax=Fusarium napiforme TaxID=42672 RepID=A0A8H5MJY1_9HYPO|nr:hypothetical protein FNAPI_13172 [Fusarium napiforme]
MNIPTVQGNPMQTSMIQIEHSVSILNALSSPNAPLRASNATPSTVREDMTRRAVKEATVAPWVDFDLNTLTKTYKSLLAQQVMPPRGVKNGNFDIRTVHDATTMFIEHIVPRLENPISVGATFLGAQFTVRFPAVVVKVGNDVESYNPPLSFVTEDGSQTLLVGLVVHAKAWNSNKLLYRETAVSKRPILRIAKYCMLARTRYGFIMSTDGLVVVRISGDVFDTTAPLHVEWRAIPWVAQGPDGLTFCLSLWLLVMLDLDDLRLSTYPFYNDQFPPHIPPRRSLNVWVCCRTPKGFFYRHPSSGQRCAELPEGAEFEDSPNGTSS